MSDTTPKVTEKDIDNAVLTTKDILDKQKKVKVKLFLSNDDRQKIESEKNAGRNVVWPFETVNINGHTYQIQRGVEVQVPESVYDILSQANII